MFDNGSLNEQIRLQGYAFAAADELRPLLDFNGPLSDWEVFAASWNDLRLDTYMADGGRYRKRRHAVYTVTADGQFRREPHQPHYQELDYNRLHGGIERWFEPVLPDVGAGPTLTAVLRFCADIFGALARETSQWRVEAHQFRIEMQPGETGHPTPEGAHRDGVDYVFVLMIRRHNLQSGTTTIHQLDGRQIGAFTLTQPFDAALVEDKRVLHGVTPVTPLLTDQPAYRDVLVVTFKASGQGTNRESAA